MSNDRDRRARDFLDHDPREARGIVLFVEHVWRVAFGEKEKAIEPSEAAFDVVRAHELFDEVDRGRVRRGGNARVLVAVHARDLDVAIVDLAGEMRGGARGLAASDLSIVDDE